MARPVPGMTVVIFAGGDPPPDAVLRYLPDDGLVIAADSGLDHAHRLGVDVHHMVGDMDSVDVELLDGLAASVVIDRHPAAKDATDLELAVDVALRSHPDEIVIVGGHGGRNDHLIANALLLASPRLGHTLVRWLAGPDFIHIVHDSVAIHGEIGSTVSLIPASDTDGVTTAGLRWALMDDALRVGTTRGVSNELIAPTATVSLASGTLFVVQPGVVG